MKTTEIERRLGIGRDTLRYYEREGLVAPKRNDDNNYREYSEEDYETLQRIILLRSLGVPVADIRNVIQESCSLEAVLTQRIDGIEAETDFLVKTREICRTLASKHTTFQELEAESILKEEPELAAHFEEILRDDASFHAEDFTPMQLQYMMTGKINLRGAAAELVYLEETGMIDGNTPVVSGEEGKPLPLSDQILLRALGHDHECDGTDELATALSLAASAVAYELYHTYREKKRKAYDYSREELFGHGASAELFVAGLEKKYQRKHPERSFEAYEARMAELEPLVTPDLRERKSGSLGSHGEKALLRRKSMLLTGRDPERFDPAAYTPMEMEYLVTGDISIKGSAAMLFELENRQYVRIEEDRIRKGKEPDGGEKVAVLEYYRGLFYHDAEEASFSRPPRILAYAAHDAERCIRYFLQYDYELFHEEAVHWKDEMAAVMGSAKASAEAAVPEEQLSEMLPRLYALGLDETNRTEKTDPAFDRYLLFRKALGAILNDNNWPRADSPSGGLEHAFSRTGAGFASDTVRGEFRPDYTWLLSGESVWQAREEKERIDHEAAVRYMETEPKWRKILRSVRRKAIFLLLILIPVIWRLLFG